MLYVSRIVTDSLKENSQNVVHRRSPRKPKPLKEPLSKSSENMEHIIVSPVQSQGPRKSPRKQKPVQSQELRKSPRKRKQNVHNVQPSKKRKMKVKRPLNVNLLTEFKEMTKDDEDKIQAYQQSKDAKIAKQQELITAQDSERAKVIDANQKVRSRYYEDLWGSKPVDTIMERHGRGRYSRTEHIGKTDNWDESRHMDAESKRLRCRGKQYMSLKTYQIKPARKVIIFINFNGILLYLKYFLQLILIIWSFIVFNMKIYFDNYETIVPKINFVI